MMIWIFVAASRNRNSTGGDFLASHVGCQKVLADLSSVLQNKVSYYPKKNRANIEVAKSHEEQLPMKLFNPDNHKSNV